MEARMSKVQVGDLVTWRKAGRPGFEPLGIANCKVIELGESEGGEPAALIEAMGQQVGALIRDLHPQDNN
jgi:hypothetical protein